MNVPRVIRGQVAMKVESSPGVDIFAGTYTSADIIQVIADSIRFTQDPNEIPNTMTAGNMGRAPSILGPLTARVDFDCWFRGAGAAYDDSPEVVPGIDRPLRACRMGRAFSNAGLSNASLVYQQTDTEESFTVYVVEDVPSGNARSYQLVGCMGTHTWSISAGGGMRFSFSIYGQLEEIADISYVAGSIVLTPAYPTLKSAAFQIGAANYAPRFRDISWQQNQTVVPVPSENAVGAVAGFAVMDRNPRLTFDPEVDREANSGWWTALSTGAPLKDVTFTMGTSGGWNQLKFKVGAAAGNQGQVVSQGLSSRDGIVTAPTVVLATISAGNDDYSYTFDNA